jgi:hypothetical protein
MPEYYACQERLQGFKIKVMNFCMVGQMVRCGSTFIVLRKNDSRFKGKAIFYNQKITKFMPQLEK